MPSVNIHACPINGTVHNACMAHAYAQESMVARIATKYFEVATAFICPGIYQAWSNAIGYDQLLWPCVSFPIHLHGGVMWLATTLLSCLISHWHPKLLPSTVCGMAHSSFALTNHLVVAWRDNKACCFVSTIINLSMSVSIPVHKMLSALPIMLCSDAFATIGRVCGDL